MLSHSPIAPIGAELWQFECGKVQINMEITRENFRAMILYDFRLHLTPRECHARLVQAFGDQAPSLSTVRNWFWEFERGREFLSDELREGRPSERLLDTNIDAVKAVIDENRKSTLFQISTQTGIPMTTVSRILKEQLRVTKLCCRWVPHKLTEEQMHLRVDWCHKMLMKFRIGSSKLVFSIATGDESWIYQYDPETKQQSAQWTFDDEPTPTKIRQARSVGKKMVAVYFGKSGHIATIELEGRRTVNAEWYTTICMPEVLSALRHGSPNRRILLHEDNAPAHKAKLTQAFYAHNKVELTGHPPYSPDLAPCDFWLFPRIKAQLRGKYFSSAEDALDAFKNAILEVPPNFWSDCFDSWFERMQKCIDCKGEYFEKIKYNRKV
jgi:[histone H3]-lysine36 N-dimethyltransferase SETMAR